MAGICNKRFVDEHGVWKHIGSNDHVRKKRLSCSGYLDTAHKFERWVNWNRASGKKRKRRPGMTPRGPGTGLFGRAGNYDAYCDWVHGIARADTPQRPNIGTLQNRHCNLFGRCARRMSATILVRGLLFSKCVV